MPFYLRVRRVDQYQFRICAFNTEKVLWLVKPSLYHDGTVGAAGICCLRFFFFCLCFLHICHIVSPDITRSTEVWPLNMDTYSIWVLSAWLRLATFYLYCKYLHSIQPCDCLVSYLWVKHTKPQIRPRHERCILSSVHFTCISQSMSLSEPQAVYIRC